MSIDPFVPEAHGSDGTNVDWCRIGREGAGDDRGDKHGCATTDNGRVRFRPLGEDYFEIEGRPEPVRVVRDARGVVVALEVLAGQGARFTRVQP